MYQYFAVIGIALGLPSAALAFPIDVELQPETIQMYVSTTDLANMAAVMLTSRESTTLQCRVGFTNGPERPVPRQVSLPPGEQVTISQFFRREINRVRVKVDCASERQR